MADESFGLVHRDQRAAVVDPDELGILQVRGQTLSVLGWHQPVLAGPHHKDGSRGQARETTQSQIFHSGGKYWT